MPFPHNLVNLAQSTLSVGLAIGLSLGAASTALSAEGGQANSAQAPTAAWYTLTSEMGAFRIDMPSQPAVYTLPAVETTLNSRMFMQMQLVDAENLEIYAAAFVDSAVPLEEEASLEDTLTSCVRSLSSSEPSRLSELISTGNYLGLEAEFATLEGGTQISRCYVPSDRTEGAVRLYMLTATREPFAAGPNLLPFRGIDATAGDSPGPAEEAASSPAQSEPSEDSQSGGNLAGSTRSLTMERFFNSFEIL